MYMGRRKKKPEKKEHITKDILLRLLQGGALLGVALIAPNAIRMLKPLSRNEEEWENYYPSSLQRYTMRLWRKGLVDVKETSEGYTVVITEKGKTEILRYDMEAMSIKKQDPWDRKWRMIFFDIPTGEDSPRHAFREHLRSMGFFMMQKSVYVHPYPCHKQVQFLREVFGIPHSVKLATVDFLENDDDLRRFFRLG